MTQFVRFLFAATCLLFVASVWAQDSVVVIPLGDGAPACPEPFLQCGDNCVDSRVDESNCGVCGQMCAQGELCDNGMCVISCPVNQVECNGQCSNTDTDVFNCGRCGNICGAGQICNRGSCQDPGSG